MVFNVLFAWHYGYVGLAMATALSAFVNMALLYKGLHKAKVYQVSAQTIGFIVRLTFAGIAMVGVILYLIKPMELWVQMTLMARVWELSVLILMGGGTYLITALIAGVRFSQLKARI
jgi:putative peptidoglycan lipid II flippase